MFQEQLVPEAPLTPHLGAQGPATVNSWLLELLQVLALTLPAALAAPALAGDTDTPPQVLAAEMQSSVADDEKEDEDDGAEYPDDGSHALRQEPSVLVPERLLPIGATEEKDLLGDWGDAAAEAED